MELYDNQPTLFPPLHTQRGWEAFKHLSEMFSLPWKYKCICFDLISIFLFLTISCPIHKCTKKNWIYSSAIIATKDKFYFHINTIFSSKGSFVDVVPHQLANMSFRQLIWLWCAEEQTQLAAVAPLPLFPSSCCLLRQGGASHLKSYLLYRHTCPTGEVGAREAPTQCALFKIHLEAQPLHTHKWH